LETLTGTLRYCSLNAHLLNEQSRRDDLEAIGNILMYFLNEGILPWMSFETKNKSKQIDSKQNMDFDVFLKGHPQCFVTYMKYVRGLEF